MRWIKHLTFASEDETMASLITEFGAEGYGIYWLVLEKIATLMDGNDNTFVRYHIKKWSNVCGVSPGKFLKVVSFLSNSENFRSKNSAFNLKLDGKYIEINCSKLLKYRDEYTKKKSKKEPKTPDKVPIKSEQTPAQELDTKLDTKLDTQGKGKVKDSIKDKTPQAATLQFLFLNIRSNFTEKELKNCEKDFIEKWTEKSNGNKKERWQKEKTFDVNLRFKTWIKNDKEWYPKKWEVIHYGID